MKDGLVIDQKVIGHDAPVATPPEDFRAHQGDCFCPAHCDQLFKTAMEIISQSVIGIIMKTLDPPVSICVNGHSFTAWAAAAQFRNVSVANALSVEFRYQGLSIKVTIAPGIGESPYIGNLCHSIMAQECYEILQRVR
ncbi:hypothetical protein AA0473_2086 [Acetobacter orleanensis NRIC 0473]|uniref:Uncharacterized protein n=1 Tax=Acetobacter orleanensis TaxID=104099 RepID=A0A4Y3TLX5_9PROT|nr:hypothetical protein Abol_015_204 [Acetobacter orleanensis JCM 7639]GBR29691.1 hypothetical protein AA0473_2086 [Acetobacter orleanensis NRIC 0473]GEB82788.1 hypothetical protein AOR01nite_12650 [Acetobacter orleanensis]